MWLDFPGGSVVKNLLVNVGDTGDTGSIPGLGWSPGGRNSNLLQYSCLENSMDRGAWQATVHNVTERWMRLSDGNMHRHTLTHVVKATYIFCYILLLNRVNAYIILCCLIRYILKDHSLHGLAEKLILTEYQLWTRHCRAHYVFIAFILTATLWGRDCYYQELWRSEILLYLRASKLASRFMDAGRSYETPEAEVKLLLHLKPADSISFISASVSPGPQILLGWCALAHVGLYYSWGDNPKLRSPSLLILWWETLPDPCPETDIIFIILDSKQMCPVLQMDILHLSHCSLYKYVRKVPAISASASKMYVTSRDSSPFYRWGIWA